VSRTFRVVVVRIQPIADDLTEAGIARALRQAGFEVIVAAPSEVVERAAEAVLQEDADAVVVAGSGAGASTGSSGPDLIEAALSALGLDDVAVVTGSSPDDVVARLGQALGTGPSGLGADEDS
jgi:methylmalonyl-CoA mutase cobalamin-binding domain/chain